MEQLAQVTSVALAVVLAVSGVAKLLDAAGTREAVVGFGVPGPLVSVVAALLAPVELLVALLLVLPPTRLLGLTGALLLLLAFTGAVVVALATGRRPDCHCFGRLGGGEVSGRTAARNTILLALATAGLVAQVRSGSDARLEWSSVALGALLGAALVAGEALTGRLARQRRDAENEEAFAEEARASPAPHFRAQTLTGKSGLDDLLARGLPVLLVTLSPGCGPCKRLRPEVASWSETFRDRLTVAVLATGPRERNEAGYAEWASLPVFLDDENVRGQLGTTGTPSAVLIGPDGMLASSVANGEKLIRRLVATAVTGMTAPDGDPEEVPAEWVRASAIDLSTVVGRRPTVQTHELGDSTVLVDGTTGATVVLDRIGVLVWSVLDGTAGLGVIVEDLAEVFEQPVENIAPGVVALVRSLAEAGLLTGARPTDPDESTPEAALVPARVDP